MAKVQTKQSHAAKVRAKLNHPIIDSDGHIVEFTPVLVEYIRREGGAQAAAKYAAAPVKRQFSLTEDQGAPVGTPTAWVWPAKNTRDRATAGLPRLLLERLEEFGFDFAIMYPSEGLFPPHLEDDELRAIASRAYNRMVMDLFGKWPQRMTPVAVIPMHTPQEAIAELEYAVKTLGFKTIVVRAYVRRQVNGREIVDVLGLHSRHDYDPFWAKCAELQVAPTFHSAAMWSPRQMPNYDYGHIGALATGNEAVAKALFMGGVTRRFPQLNFAFLEGGVAWGCQLYADLVSHWEKRGRHAIDYLDPNSLDVQQMLGLIDRYGDGVIAEKREELQAMFSRRQQYPTQLDDFAAAKISRREDVRDLYVPRFFFGCEADDPMNSFAFNRKVNPMNVALRAIMGSDIGHWDVPQMNEVLEEAWEQVEHGLIGKDDFRDFAFANTVRLHGGVNPGYFKGTAIEREAAQVLAAATL
ncbi:MAG: amidohydrolase [Dehalococcoidia bacterium]|nr:amidohydrolase [Dehalococcoidia bacterium]